MAYFLILSVNQTQSHCPNPADSVILEVSQELSDKGPIAGL